MTFCTLFYLLFLINLLKYNYTIFITVDLMANKVHSFSTRTIEDEELVKKLKLKAQQEGRSFSWIVMQALKLWEGQANENK